MRSGNARSSPEKGSEVGEGEIMQDDDLVPIQWGELKQICLLLKEIAEIISAVLEEISDIEPYLTLVKKDDDEKSH